MPTNLQQFVSGECKFFLLILEGGRELSNGFSLPGNKPLPLGNWHMVSLKEGYVEEQNFIGIARTICMAV